MRRFETCYADTIMKTFSDFMLTNSIKNLTYHAESFYEINKKSLVPSQGYSRI